MVVWLTVALLLALIMGLPYSLYLDSQKLEQPVVVFKAHIWREASNVVPLLIFLGMLLVLAGVLATRPASGPVAWLSAVALALVGLGLGFIMLRRHISYWQHDRHATLAIYRQEQRAEYRNKDVLVSFALADVVQITHHTADSGRAIYSYRVFTLRDGTELLLTCLMYSMLGPQELMPDVPRQTVRCRFCWLPGDKLNFPTLL